MKAGARSSLITVMVVLSAWVTPAIGQDAAKVQAGSYRVVLDNASVRVLEFTGRPGMGVCGSGVHSHPAHLTVLLTPAKVRAREDGKVVVLEFKSGDAFWSGPVTHETENVGGAAVRSLIIEVKHPVNGR